MSNGERSVELLNRNFDELARALVSRHLQKYPEIYERFGKNARSKCLEDAKSHLCYLSESLSTQRPSIFSRYVAWSGDLLAHRGIPKSDLAAHLQLLSELLKEMLPDDFSALPTTYINEALLKLSEPRTKTSSYMESSGPLARLSRHYLESLLVFRREEAINSLLKTARAGVPVGDIYRHVLEPCQREIGRLWQTNEVSVAQEHYSTAATQLAMAKLHQFAKIQHSRDRAVLVSSVEGELHDVGARMVSDFLETDGWETFFLGANTPHQALAQTVVTMSIDLLALSATVAASLDAVAEAIAISRKISPMLLVIVGGAAFNNEPGLWEHLHADAYAGDAGSALAVADSLFADNEHRSIA